VTRRQPFPWARDMRRVRRRRTMVRKNMATRHRTRARRQAALRRIIEATPVRESTRAAAARVVDLCREVQDAIEDVTAREVRP